jgi:hypothetical protein
MNGGASLTVAGRRADVVYRDLDAVEHWVAEASEGRFEIDAVDGWLAGLPTYVLVGELARGEALASTVAKRLKARSARPRRGAGATRRQRARDRRVARVAGDVAGCVGLLAKAAVAAARPGLPSEREWAVSEGGIVRRAGLGRSEAISGGYRRPSV